MTGLKIAVLADQERNSDYNARIVSDVTSMLAAADHAVLISGDLSRSNGDISRVINKFPYTSTAGSGSHLASGVDVATDWQDASVQRNITESLERKADIAVLMPGAGLQELSQAVYMARRGMPLIVLNDDGYFDGLKQEVQQVRDTLGALNDGNGVALQEWDHISFVSLRSDVIAQVANLHEKGIPAQNKEERRHYEHNAHQLMKNNTGAHEVDYSVHSEQGRSVGTLLHGATFEGVDRLLNDMVSYNAISVIDNTDDYHAGLIQQFERMLNEGVETYESIYDRALVVADGDEAEGLRKEIFSSHEFSDFSAH
ncbi:MAG: hypothetical protein ACRBDI_04465 [Alphaproteobacteria bacterium]